jgi:tRNA threonylcarbamoyl adenosine modification protein (Sua5/YciO/YrdC/YwlC family)
MFAQAVKALAQGEVIAVPTEAVFGLSVDPQNILAVQKLLDLKKRNPDKGLIIVAADLTQLEPYIDIQDIHENILSTWPGPYTWVFPAKSSVSSLLRGKHSTIAVRVTAHPVMSGLCAEFGGALVSSSANFEGLSPALTSNEIQDYFGKDLVIVPGALGGRNKPTEIRDALTGEIIRPSP